MPSVIKRRFQQRTPLVMGAVVCALMGGGGLGAAITPPLVQHTASNPGGGKDIREVTLPPQDNNHLVGLPARGRWVFTSV